MVERIRGSRAHGRGCSMSLLRGPSWASRARRRGAHVTALEAPGAARPPPAPLWTAPPNPRAWIAPSWGAARAAPPPGSPVRPRCHRLPPSSRPLGQVLRPFRLDGVDPRRLRPPGRDAPSVYSPPDADDVGELAHGAVLAWVGRHGRDLARPTRLVERDAPHLHRQLGAHRGSCRRRRRRELRQERRARLALIGTGCRNELLCDIGGERRLLQANVLLRGVLCRAFCKGVPDQREDDRSHGPLQRRAKHSRGRRLPRRRPERPAPPTAGPRVRWTGQPRSAAAPQQVTSRERRSGNATSAGAGGRRERREEADAAEPERDVEV